MKKVIFISFLLSSLHAISQQSSFILNNGGGTTAISPNFIVDWNIGESAVIETYYGENPIAYPNVGLWWNVTSGFLQPFDNTHIIFNAGITTWAINEIHFYPVPTSDLITIDFRSATTGNISIQLLSSDGRLLGLRKFTQINSTATQVWNLSTYPSGLYFFKIVLSSMQGDILKQGTFKIEKIN